MSELAKLLHTLSVEAGVATGDPDDHSFVGAEEITVVTDETQTELEEAVAETAAEVEKLENGSGAAEKIIEAVESVESKLAQIRAMRDNGEEMNHGALRWFIQGVAESVEARQLPGELLVDHLGALQHSFESNELTDYTTEAEEKTGGVLSRIWAVLVRALTAARTSIAQFFGTIGRSAGAIKTGGEQIKRLAKGIKGAPKKDKIKTSGYKYLVVGGSINADKAVRDSIGVLKGDLNTKILTPLKNALKPIVDTLTAKGSANDVIDANWTSKAASMGLRDQTINLAGGVNAALKVEEGKVSFSIGKPSGDGVAESAPLNASELATLGNSLVVLGTAMAAAKANADQFVAEAEAALSAAKKFAGKDKEEGAKERKEGVGKAVTLATKVIKSGEGVIPAYVRYMGLLGKDAYNFGKASLGAYSTKEPKPEGEDANKENKDNK